MENHMDEVRLIRPAMRYALWRSLHWALLALLFLSIAWFLVPAFVLVSVLCMGIGFYQLLYVRCTLYTLSNEVLLAQAGIFFKRTDHLALFRVKDFVVTESLLMQLLGLMSLELLTTDLSGPVMMLRGIPKSDILAVLQERVMRARANNRIVELN